MRTQVSKAGRGLEKRTAFESEGRDGQKVARWYAKVCGEGVAKTE